MTETNFQHTEIGDFPSAWKVTLLGDLCKVNGRVGFKGYNKSDLVSQGMGAYTIGCKHISKNHLDLSDPDYISWPKYYESPEIMVKSGDILLAQRGTLGVSAIVPPGIGCATINPSLVLLNNIKCCNSYLDYFLKAKSSVDELLQNSNQTSVPMISQKQIGLLHIAIPEDEGEQERIAIALRDIDDLIQDLRALIAKKQDIRTATMRQLLSGETRLRGFTKDWIDYKLNDLAALFKGKGLSKGKISPSGKYKCMLYGEIFTTYDYYVDECVSHTDYYEGAPSVAGDVLMPASTTTCGRDLAKAVAVLEDGILLGGDIIIIRNANKMFDNVFLAALLTDLYKDQVEEVAHGVTIIHLTTRNIENFSMHIPSDIKEQQAIAEVLRDMNDEINVLEERLQKYQDLRSGMMQQLLTGKIRLI